MNKIDIKIKMERLKNQIKQTETKLIEQTDELDKLEKDYERKGPRMFIIHEASQSDVLAIAGKWDPFTVTEVYEEPKNLDKGYIFVKQVVEE